jgi:hypothetical protein
VDKENQAPGLSRKHSKSYAGTTRND